MGISFRVIPSAYRESGSGSRITPSRLVMKHAAGKVRRAEAPQENIPILGADTIVYCKRKIFGKPKSREEARRMLRTLSGRRHSVYTGVALWDPVKKRVRSGYARSNVLFKKLTAREIGQYLARVNPLDKAGAYAVQEKSRVVRILEGSYSNVVGLPVELVRSLLKM